MLPRNRSHLAELAGRQIAQTVRAEVRANELLHLQAHESQQLLHLVILHVNRALQPHLPLGNLDGAPALLRRIARHVEIPPHDAPVVPLSVDYVRVPQRSHTPLIPRSIHLDAIPPRNCVHGMFQIAGVVSVVGQEQETLCVVV